MKVLIAGGAGYIGSTIASACSDAGITPVIGADPKMRTGLQLRQPTSALGKMIQAQEQGAPFLITGTD